MPFLREFNRLLSQIIPHADKYDPGQAYVGNGYLMTVTDQDGGEGMQWVSMPCKMISERGILKLTEFDIASFQKVRGSSMAYLYIQ